MNSSLVGVAGSPEFNVRTPSASQSFFTAMPPCFPSDPPCRLPANGCSLRNGLPDRPDSIQYPLAGYHRREISKMHPSVGQGFQNSDIGL